MFNIFKKKPKEPEIPKIYDMNGAEIAVGAKVNCLRYDLGECSVELEGRQYFYVAASGQRVSYVKMIDASTKNQKVLLIES